MNLIHSTNTFRFQTLILTLLILLFANTRSVSAGNELPNKLETIEWDDSLKLPELSNNQYVGTNGAFAGFVGNQLIVAGGVSLSNDSVAESLKTKLWQQTAFAIDVDAKNATWSVYNEFLPEPLAYGVSIQLPSGVLCIGGRNATSVSDKVFLITQTNNQLAISNDWPSLPVPLANATGALLGNHVYLAGGQTSVTGNEVSNYFFMLDLNNLKNGWVELPSWPGVARSLAVSAVQKDGFDNCFYLFSGRGYKSDGSIDVLTDGYVYNPRLKTWSVVEQEFPVMAGAAMPIGLNHILFVGGVQQLPAGQMECTETDNKARLFHTITKTMIEKEDIPYPVAVNSPIIKRGNQLYLSVDELKSGVTTPYILMGEVITYEKGIGALNMLVIVIYFLVLAFMGFYFSKKQKNTDDYFKGGGRLPWWAVGLSIFGTSLSAITFMAIPAKAFATDWSYLVLNIGIVAVAPLVMFYFIPFFRRLNITTAYEFLEQRFNATIRVICSVSFILFQIGKMGIVLFLPAIALNIVTGIDIFLCIGLMGVLSIVYTAIGGIEAVVWTDALQVGVLMGGAIAIVCIAASHVEGGFTGIVQEGLADSKFDLGSTQFDIKQSTLWTVIIGSIFTNITTYGTDQTMVQRYMTTKTQKQAQKSAATNAFLAIPATLLFFFVGTALFVFYKQNPTQMSLTLTEGDAILPWYIFSQLPAGVVGLLISGIFAAAMSTLSSSLNSSATAYVVDIHHKVFRKNSTNNDLRVAKICTLILGVISISFAFMMATWNVQSLWDEFNKILGIILGSMGGLFLLGMLTKRANSFGALCGMIGSFAIQFIFLQNQTIHLLLFTATGFVSCFVIGYLTSFLATTKKK